MYSIFVATVFLVFQTLIGIQESRASVQPDVKIVVKTDQNMKLKMGSDDGLINADFPEPTDIRDIARAFSLWLDTLFEVEDGLQTKVKLNSPERVTKQEALKRFNLMLTANKLRSLAYPGKTRIVAVASSDCGMIPPGTRVDANCRRTTLSQPNFSELSPSAENPNRTTLVKGRFKGIEVHDYTYLKLEADSKVISFYCMIPKCSEWEMKSNESLDRFAVVTYEVRNFYFKELKENREINAVTNLEIQK